MSGRFLRASAVLVCILLPLAAAAEPVVEAPEVGYQGGIIAVIVREYDNGRAARAELRDPDDNVVSANVVFPLPGSTETRRAAVLGIPHDQVPGEYAVVILDSAGEQVTRSRMAIAGQEFGSETIPLNKPMSDLRQTDDPRRLAESKALWELLTSADTTALHHFARHQLPISEFTVTSRFGDRRVFVYTDGGAERSVHSGIDLAAPAGTPVNSSGEGRVVFAGERLITGNTLVVEYLPGVYGLYYHLQELKTERGEVVQEGEVIGLVGDTGLVTGAHLHWEFRVGGIPVDPDAMAEFEIRQ